MRVGVASPLGPLAVEIDNGAISTLRWQAHPQGGDDRFGVAAQLGEYFAGTRKAFDLPLDAQGTPFQRAVCDAMLAIPYGETRTYGEIAAALGASAQAVGNACGGNPIPIIIPCHRVLGATSLGGFSGAGGVETKVWLLRHEGAAGLLL